MDFREYKLYKHTNSGLDETTGELIHVSTSIIDTVFKIEELNPLETYYFRIYVLNEFGRLGGSNLVNAKTDNQEILKNSSFEIIDSNTGFPKNWDCDAYGTYWFLDESNTLDGKYCLMVKGMAGVIMPWQTIDPSYLVAGSRYKLCYWIKHDEFKSGELNEFNLFLDNTEYTWHIQTNTISGPLPASEWKEYNYEFTMPSVIGSNFNLRLYFYLGNETYAWIDNLSLIKVE
jgi:hypothetical protein